MNNTFNKKRKQKLDVCVWTEEINTANRRTEPDRKCCDEF